MRLNAKVLLFLCALGLAPLAVAQTNELIELQSVGTRVYGAARGQSLAPASSGGPASTVRSFLADRGASTAALDSLFIRSEHRAPGTGITHYRFEQRVAGLDVYGTYVKAAVDSRGNLMHVIELLAVPPVALTPATVSPSRALDAVARQLYPAESFVFTEAGRSGNTLEFNANDEFFFQNPKVTRVAAPLNNAVMQESFLVETWTREGNQLHHTLVSGSGRILRSELRTANEQYLVYPEHPNVGTQSYLSGPVATATAPSPEGWISSRGRTGGIQYQFRMSGNNVDAYLDRDNNNSPDAAGAVRNGTDFGIDLLEASDPTVAQNQEAAITHLMYSNNVLHDKLYTHGFTETAGNFQEYNFGKGGLQNDSVMAEAQDGGGTNNANFATPADGSRPRMQMYIWDYSNPRRDGDVDSDIVFHEYGHGLTWRMIGSMSGCMAGAIGEGASDTVSIFMNPNDVVGEFSYNNPIGIRRYAYTNYPLTYGDLTTEGVHAAGELFAAIMWRAREKFLANSIATDDLWQAFIDGMNYIPAGPKFENMRDGIVQSAGTGTPKGCLIYEAFAEFGVGQGAVGSCTTTGFFFPRTKWTNTESFVVPSECANPPEPVADVAVTQISAASPVFTSTTQNATVTVSNAGTAATSGAVTVAMTANNGAIVNTTPQTVNSLAAGASVNLNFAWTAPSSSATVTLEATATYTDNNQANNSLSKNVTVQAESPQEIMLTVTKVVSKKLRSALLQWTGTLASQVDIIRDGAKINTVDNSGSYTDANLTKGQTYTYKVCVAGSSTACSNLVSVTM